MDQILLPKNAKYIAENLVRCLTTPTLIPSILYSVLGGILTFAIYDKYVRKGYFLPYIYFGTTAQRQYLESHEGDNEQEDVKSIAHENALYGSLIIAAVGSYFAILGLLRLLEIWIRVGLQRNLHLSKYYLGILTAILSAIPFIIVICGDVLLIKESGLQEDEDSEQVKKALTLRLIASIFNVLLILFYFIICLAYAWSTYISNVIEKTLLKSEKNSISTKTIALVQKTFKKTLSMLIVLGLLSLARFLHDLYVTALVIKDGPVWDANSYLVLVVIDGLALLTVTYLCNLSNVKELIVFSKMRSEPRSKKKKENNTEEVILLSRSPIHFDVER
ncbi:hypothetical protein MFLAVUS_009532 [Mucor flavus]|uniref:Gustatory receptor n=1 Tax=Mucor flavus TaxID=439312 RepID=A0ABP9ZA52_9FUNG